MARATGQRRPIRRPAAPPGVVRAGADWSWLGLAVLGLILTTYLTVSAWTGRAVAGCAAGSGCDVVLGSRWARLFGLPTSFWGFLAYGSVAGLAFVTRPDLRWKLTWIVSVVGALYSVYLTAVSVFTLKTACPYCLASLGLWLAILALGTTRRPAALPRFSWRPWLLRTVTGALVLVLALHLHYVGMWSAAVGPEDPRVRALAEHLARTQARFYGASWCSHCREQKELFGASAHRLPYVECSPSGRGRPEALACLAMNIRVYPTWVINGRRIEGVLTLRELAQYGAFPGTLP